MFCVSDWNFELNQTHFFPAKVLSGFFLYYFLQFPGVVWGGENLSHRVKKFYSVAFYSGLVEIVKGHFSDVKETFSVVL